MRTKRYVVSVSNRELTVIELLTIPPSFCFLLLSPDSLFEWVRGVARCA